ncbi:MAG: DegT/DnrJ/EryC1/StrS family aminotransferase [Paracoccaceae bacterium]|jgi:dTDP-4-amino-4,6-dideoxygalactose transaminase|nr:DegT/DnrJ/EryC1/StrS family aminotransferase [Paracoccaceae bacterium]
MVANDDFLIFGQPLIGEAEIAEVVDSLRSAWIGFGPKTKQFERDFAEYKSCPSAVALNSGTAALFHALDAEGIGPGDEVITTAVTFVASINAILHVGATPIVVDIDPQSYNIDPDAIRNAVTPKTRAIIPVHLGGLPCDMGSIMSIAKEHDLIVIEDAAHAVETEYFGQKIGTIGDYGCFSFYPTKNLTTGEGGMLLARDPEKLELARSRSAHGLSADAYSRFTSTTFAHYRATQLGYKNNMSDLQGALGIHQLARLDENWKVRQKHWNFYHDNLAGLGLVLPMIADQGIRHAYHLFSVLVTPEFGMDRDMFIAALSERGIGSGVHYLSMTQHPFHAETLGFHADDFQNAESVSSQTVSIPLSAALTDDNVKRVVGAIVDIHASLR